MPIFCVYGEEGAGKTLFSEVFARTFGGHSAENCFAYLTGRTDENKALAASPVWKMDDQVPDWREMDRYNSNLKAVQADASYPMRALYCDRISVQTFRTLMILNNHNQVGLSMLPDPSLDGGFHKKVIAFICDKTGFLSGLSREDIDGHLDREIAMFRSYCLGFEPTLDVRSPERTGVQQYWDSNLVEEAAMTSIWSSRLIHLFNENAEVNIEPGRYIAFRHHELSSFITDDDTSAGRRLWGKLHNVHTVPGEMATRWPHLVKLFGDDLWVFRDGPSGLSDIDKPWPEDFAPVPTTKALKY